MARVSRPEAGLAGYVVRLGLRMVDTAASWWVFAWRMLIVDRICQTLLDMDKTHAGHAVGKTEPNRYFCHGAFASPLLVLWSSENVQSLFRVKPVELNYSIVSLLWATRHFQQPGVERKREKAYSNSLLLDFSSFYKIACDILGRESQHDESARIIAHDRCRTKR